MDSMQNFRRQFLLPVWMIAALLPAILAPAGMAQSLEDLNIQIHGYATQSFLYTTQNNILTTHSSDGSPAWTEAVVNVTAQPSPKLRVGVQARYFVLGNYGNSITLDWAAADYKVDDRFGVRFGKVKTPNGLFNEIQDIDPSYMWSLLPQGVYPISSRNSVLAHYGGVVYGTLNAGKAGKLEYRGWGGERIIGSDDGYTLAQRESGVDAPNGIAGVTSGGALRWRTPLPGLMLGVSDTHDEQWTSIVTAGGGAVSGTETINPLNQQDFFGKYEKDKVMLAAEWDRLPVIGSVVFPGVSTSAIVLDQRAWYAMGSYKLTAKLMGGVYVSQSFDHQAALGPARYSKDWAISGRYDFNEFLYAKAEQHFIDGTEVGYDTQLNPNGLKPDTRLTILKIGVSF
jgi:hypothetical protein